MYMDDFRICHSPDRGQVAEMASDKTGVVAQLLNRQVTGLLRGIQCIPFV